MTGTRHPASDVVVVRGIVDNLLPVRRTEAGLSRGRRGAGVGGQRGLAAEVARRSPRDRARSRRSGSCRSARPSTCPRTPGRSASLRCGRRGRIASIVCSIGDAVRRAVVARDDRDLVVARRSVDADRSAVSARSRVTWSIVFSSVAEASMPITRRSSRSSSAKPAIIPACVEPVTVHTTTCRRTRRARPPGRRPRAPSWRSRDRRAGDRTHRQESRTAFRPPLDRFERTPPLVADADVEAGRIDADVAAHDPRQLDVADLVVVDVGPVDPRSWTVTPSSPRWQATPVTWRVWFDWMPPIDTSVSQPWSIASATRYSSRQLHCRVSGDRPALRTGVMPIGARWPPRTVLHRRGCDEAGRRLTHRALDRCVRGSSPAPRRWPRHECDGEVGPTYLVLVGSRPCGLRPGVALYGEELARRPTSGRVSAISGTAILAAAA